MYFHLSPLGGNNLTKPGKCNPVYEILYNLHFSDRLAQGDGIENTKVFLTIFKKWEYPLMFANRGKKMEITFLQACLPLNKKNDQMLNIPLQQFQSKAFCF